MNQFNLSDESVASLLKLQAIYAGRTGNFSKIEDSVDRLRYRVSDIVMTEIMNQLEQQQLCPRLK